MAALCQILEWGLWIAVTSRFARDGGRGADVLVVQAGTRHTRSEAQVSQEAPAPAVGASSSKSVSGGCTRTPEPQASLVLNPYFL